jgi:hypothetical protein
MLVNKLPFKIRVSQFRANEKIILEPGQRRWYNFKNAKKQVDKKLTIGNGIEEAETPMSAPFFLEDLNDFQLSYKSVVESNSEEPTWYEPRKENDMTRCVRVIITSQDDATLFIYFQNPEIPEYSVTNATTDYVTVKIKDKKEYFH